MALRQEAPSGRAGSPAVPASIPPADNSPAQQTINSPTYETPLRHHERHPSTPRQVKETLHATSEWSNSGDDGTTVHRINQYVIREEIGRGSFGAVHLAVDQYGQEYAVKEFSKSRLRKRAQSHILRRPHGRGGRPFSPGTRPGSGFGHSLSPQHSHHSGTGSGSTDNPLELIREEIAIMKKINHPNLVSLLEVLDDPEEDSLYMVLEMCKKGVIMKVAMHEPADPYDDESCRCWFRDLILGIEYLHAQGVAHRDIKPDNLLLTEDDELKIVDFGVSEMFEKTGSDSLSTKSAGSPAFLPPELCVTKHGNISGKAADIWSMGVTLYCLAFGRVPFEKTNILELYQSIRDDPILVKDDIDQNFRDLIYRLLEKDPEKRIKMEELREHPWVTRSGADPLMSTSLNVTSVLSPPTAEEVSRAITKNMGNLLAVVKAVKQFKRLLYRRRPELFGSILGSTSRMVEPPMTMSAEQVEKLHPGAGTLRMQTTGLDAQIGEAVGASLAMENSTTPNVAWDRAPLGADETATKGAAASASPLGARDENVYPAHPKSGSASTPEPVPGAHTRPFHPEHPEHPHHHRTGTAHEGKGQAHDPLTDTIYLGIGASGDDGSSSALPEAQPSLSLSISESPSADDTNIYEKAYEQEIERIRREHGRHATFYLTRRVDDMRDKLQALRSPTLGGGEGAARLAEVVESGKARGAQGVEKAADVFKGLKGKLGGVGQGART